jgi:hypothetical protein
MPFILPDVFTKELAPSSQKIYRSRLNALAKEGYDTQELLLSQKLQVIRAIKKLEPDDDAMTRMRRRQYLSAIFWVTPTLKGKKSAYYSFYQKNLPQVDGWKKAADFKAAE